MPAVQAAVLAAVPAAPTGGSTSSTGTANALTSSDLLYNGLTYVIQHPFVNDPVRPGKVDRIVAASFAFGTTQTFQSEVDAYQNYPQIVIALKNAYHKFLKEGIAPDRGRGRIWRPAGSGGADHIDDRGAGGARRGGGTGGTRCVQEPLSRAPTTPTTRRRATPTACHCRRCSTR